MQLPGILCIHGTELPQQMVCIAEHTCLKNRMEGRMLDGEQVEALL